MTEVHIIPDGERWKVEHDGDDLLVFDTKDAAIHAGREVAKAAGCDVVVQEGPSG
jgi:hypothetical protein